MANDTPKQASIRQMNLERDTMGSDLCSNMRINVPRFRSHHTNNPKENMSHFATITTQIKDIAALREACRELGVELIENTTARGYGSNKQHGDFVVRLRGPYDVAVDRQDDGTYGLTTDWWEGHVEKEVGANYGRLIQLYGVHKARIEAQRKGYTVRRQTLGDGAIKLVIGGI